MLITLKCHLKPREYIKVCVLEVADPIQIKIINRGINEKKIQKQLYTFI